MRLLNASIIKDEAGITYSQKLLRYMPREFHMFQILNLIFSVSFQYYIWNVTFLLQDLIELLVFLGIKSKINQ